MKNVLQQINQRLDRLEVQFKNVKTDLESQMVNLKSDLEVLSI